MTRITSLLMAIAAAALYGSGSAHPVARANVEHAHPNCLASTIMGRDELLRVRKRAVDWGYEGAKGPFYWSTINPNYTSCSTGRFQSPVDIDSTIPATYDTPVEFYYPDNFTNVQVENLGFTVELFAPAKTAYIVRDGVKYYLANFHFHAPAEHHVEGKAHPAELHMVHRSDNGSITVLALYVENYNYEPQYWLDLFLKHVPRNETAPALTVPVYPIETLVGYFKNSELYWYYDGSLTAPPCTEGVHWIIASRPIPATKKELEWLGFLMDFNARPSQKNDNVPSSLH
ncbi:carbonic anhydrase [Gonapodya prolifera JEL478]|uniref:carbonic anhydrase n=1 Tax=Gonapodya prolifera (strain JEL478) TaxID=1344416 RepID=A0A139ASG0_GONPJ|nr:carbonic anhydrase [Gonapodya prolifera JEL478]|eukprot:KXS19483.1 carbonic anhydrase [Gonapodya prolifera JEL478]